MIELLTILSIAFALDYLLSPATPMPAESSERPSVESMCFDIMDGLITNEKAVPASPVLSALEIATPRKLSWPEASQEQTRKFHIVSGPDDSPIAIQPYLPVQYGEPYPDWPEYVCCGVELELERKTADQTFWTATYTYRDGFTSDNHEQKPLDYETLMRMRRAIEESHRGPRDEPRILEYAKADFRPALPMEYFNV